MLPVLKNNQYCFENDLYCFKNILINIVSKLCFEMPTVLHGITFLINQLPHCCLENKITHIKCDLFGALSD